MPSLDYKKAEEILSSSFKSAEREVLTSSRGASKDSSLSNDLDAVFGSTTQAYREVLLGCLLARILEPAIDISKPYVGLGESAFNGRTLDEKVINPFLQNHSIPCSRGPYLSVFRRSVRFVPETRAGVRDKIGFDALLSSIDRIMATKDRGELDQVFHELLLRFVELREAANVPISKIRQISVEQYGILFDGLLSFPSGGLIPTLLVVTTFKTIANSFNLDWGIEWQGINVADRAAGAGGDVTLSSNGKTILAVEVTERPIDKTRVVATFNTKIAPQGIEEYLFLVSGSGPSEDAIGVARQYFAQGHEINFAHIRDWILMILSILGRTGRQDFTKEFLTLLEGNDVPTAVKVAWNDRVKALIAG
jgi:hypothetical protein